VVRAIRQILTGMTLMKKKKGVINVMAMFALLAVADEGLYAQKSNSSFSFTVSMSQPSSHRYHVVFHCKGINKDTVEFKMPAWMPGYYQILDYANNVENFNAATASNKQLKWEKSSKNAWKVLTERSVSLIISYDVKATRSFVATNYLDEERGYIAPTGLFLYPSGFIKHPVTVRIEPYPKWTTVATGLDTVRGKHFTFSSPDFDVLFDSPVLMGSLESFPSFSVNSIPHHFVAYRADSFDRKQFMQDLKKIVTTASGIIGEIPYKRYVFLGLGPGGGGIEHLNSASIAFTGRELSNAAGRIRTYNFLAHEYFHHYNVKRIRPVELGPFDYDNGSRTKMLWLSEGITVYYEYIILSRAGFTTADEVLKAFQSSIKEYESKPGRYFQTPAEASYTTWEDGPFGRTSDDVNKTISPYDKGPLLGLLLDFKIRHETKNKKSLDDIMRLLYTKYYKQKGRGFTENEFKQECESMAGVSLSDFFDYIYTLKQVDYPTYLNYAGLSIDTVAHELAGGWLGVEVRERNDTLSVTKIDWKSPAWEAGLRNRRAILQVNGNKLNARAFNELLASLNDGDKIKIVFTTSSGPKEEEITLRKKKESSFAIMPITNPGTLQALILKSWMSGK
jgi:predicted metalloprotease with PDZ domain